MKRLLIGLSGLFLVACGNGTPDTIGGDTTSERNRLAKIAKDITIIRDDYGVPHIYGKTDADAVFGMVFAQAEDDFPRVERNYYWAIGRLAEVEGEDALMSDLRARLYMSEEDARTAYAEAPDWLKELCDAWADALNYYLMVNPDVTPKLITNFEPWMPFYFFEGSIGGDIEQIPLRGISAFYGGKEVKEAALEDWEPRGSNGFAISGEHTESGDAMLLINPHTSFYFRGEMQVVSEEGLNAYGATTWGQFFIYQGFNEDTGWMHTSTYADFIDEFVEDVFEDDDGKLMYRYGNEVRPVDVSEVTLKYKSGDQMLEKTYPMYHTHHGPVTHEQDGKWVVTRINWDPVNALRQSFLRTKQSNHDEFREMMNIRTNSSNNTVYADSSGNIAYYHGNFMPVRDNAFDYSKPVDGSNPATDWKGLHEVDDMVTLLNPETGWLQNCNSTPYTAAGEFSPKREDYPAYMAPDAENFRAVHAVDLLEELGTPEQPKLTLDSLIELAYDDHLPAFEALLPGLVAAFDEQSDYQGMSEAIEELRNWDYRVSADSVAMTLAHFYAARVLSSGGEPTGISRMERIEWFGNEDNAGERLLVQFATTLKQIEDDFGQWNTPWGEVNRLQRQSGDIDAGFDDDAPSLPVGLASGRWGALAAYGARRGENTKKLYGYRGNSFVAVVEFGDKVKAKSLLAGGQSGDPESPHFYDQAQLYVDRQFKDVAFYREDVEARAVRTYSPGE